MASSQWGQPFGIWLKSTRVPEPFHVRPSASEDSPQYVVGMVPKGHLRGPILSAMWGKAQTYHCNMLEGKPSVVGSCETSHSSHAAVPADAQFLGTWHHAQGEFNLPHVGMMPGHGKLEFSSHPPSCPLTLIHTVWQLARHSTGSQVCTVWARAVGSLGSCCLALLLPLIGKKAKAGFLGQPSLLNIQKSSVWTLCLPGSGERHKFLSWLLATWGKVFSFLESRDSI